MNIKFFEILFSKSHIFLLESPIKKLRNRILKKNSGKRTGDFVIYCRRMVLEEVDCEIFIHPIVENRQHTSLYTAFLKWFL